MVKTNILIKVFFLMVFVTGTYNYGYCQQINDLCYDNMNDISSAHLLCVPYQGINLYNGKTAKYNQWGNGTVYLKTGDSVLNRHLTYSALGSNLIWNSNKTVEKSTVKSFTFFSEKDIKLAEFEYFEKGNWNYIEKQGAFLQVMVKDNVSFFKLIVVEKIPMSDDIRHHKYYYIKNKDKELQRISLSKRKLCAILEHSKEFKKHLRKKGIHANDPERMTEAVKEYNIFIKSM